MSTDEFLGKTQLSTQLSHLVFEEETERFDELESESLGQSAHVVVSLDHRRRPLDRDRLDDVRIERALGQVVDVAMLRGLVFEDLDEHATDNPPLLLRIIDTLERRQKSLACIHADDWQTKTIAQAMEHLLAFVPCATHRCQQRPPPSVHRVPCAGASQPPTSRHLPTGRTAPCHRRPVS